MREFEAFPTDVSETSSGLTEPRYFRASRSSSSLIHATRQIKPPARLRFFLPFSGLSFRPCPIEIQATNEHRAFCIASPGPRNDEASFFLFFHLFFPFLFLFLFFSCSTGEIGEPFHRWPARGWRKGRAADKRERRKLISDKVAAFTYYSPRTFLRPATGGCVPDAFALPRHLHPLPLPLGL